VAQYRRIKKPTFERLGVIWLLEVGWNSTRYCHRLDAFIFRYGNWSITHA